MMCAVQSMEVVLVLLDHILVWMLGTRVINGTHKYQHNLKISVKEIEILRK